MYGYKNREDYVRTLYGAADKYSVFDTPRKSSLSLPTTILDEATEKFSTMCENNSALQLETMCASKPWNFHSSSYYKYRKGKQFPQKD